MQCFGEFNQFTECDLGRFDQCETHVNNCGDGPGFFVTGSLSNAKSEDLSIDNSVPQE